MSACEQPIAELPASEQPDTVKGKEAHVDEGPPQLPPNQVEMLCKLKAQIEFYFSPKNLQKDEYLWSFLSHPRRVGMVPLEIICRFPRVRQICGCPEAVMADPRIVAFSLMPSDRLQVTHDGRWIVPISGQQPVVRPHFVPSKNSSSPVVKKRPMTKRGASDMTENTEATAPLTVCGSSSSSVRSCISPVSSESDLSCLSNGRDCKRFVLLLSKVPRYHSREDKLSMASEVSDLFSTTLGENQEGPTHIRQGTQPCTWACIFANKDAAEQAFESMANNMPAVRGATVEVELMPEESLPPAPTAQLTPTSPIGTAREIYSPETPMTIMPGTVDVAEPHQTSPLTISPRLSAGYSVPATCVSSPPSIPADGTPENSKLNYRPSPMVGNENDAFLVIDDEDEGIADNKQYGRNFKNNNRRSFSKKHKTKQQLKAKLQSKKVISPPPVDNERHFPSLSDSVSVTSSKVVSETVAYADALSR